MLSHLNRHHKKYLQTEKRMRTRFLEELRKHPYSARIKRALEADRPFGRSTFYNHHTNVDNAMHDLEVNMLASFRSHLKVLSQHRSSPKSYYQYLLYFLYQNRDYFDVAFKTYNLRIFHKMLMLLKPHVAANWPIYDEVANRELDYNYTALIGSTIYVWYGETHASPDFADPCLRKLLRLNNDMPHLLRSFGFIDYANH
jgi:hypothetical protein